MALFAHAPLNKLVRTNNFIDYVGIDQAPFKDTKIETDMPEVELRPSGGTIRLFSTNNSSFIDQRFEVWVKAKDQRLQKEYFAVKWEVIRALANVYNDINHLPCVTRFELGEYVEDLDDPEAQEGLTGWSGVIDMNAEMRFTNAELKILRR